MFEKEKELLLNAENKLEQNLENACRRNHKCIACGKEKQEGSIVCWDCFKYRENPFKSFTGSLTEWLSSIGKI